ncbi:MAG: 50S ribosomal protein L11 methyltransferase [Oscillospiraceae bacterium]|jgi:ribosomal protein L11 methyltransferase|nr:50S ribosomal protein L11 methyltransferase [Oscillospiraceae bacterium]
MRYNEITIYPVDTDALCFALDELSIGYAVDDPREIENLLEETKKYWDYFDESLTAERPATVKIYLTDSELDVIEQLRPLAAKIETKTVKDEDWANNWKPYWQATNLGENLVIVPSWKTVIRLDPGMLFGTGGHATTALCLEAAERLFNSGRKIESALDLGCGSGILAITAMLLGAKRAVGYDVDANMPEIASANAALNGVAPTFEVRDIFAAEISERYDLVFANIVADIIIKLAPTAAKLIAPGGVFVCSGIIGNRADEVEFALTSSGLTVMEKNVRDDWICFVTMNSEQ